MTSPSPLAHAADSIHTLTSFSVLFLDNISSIVSCLTTGTANHNTSCHFSEVTGRPSSNEVSVAPLIYGSISLRTVSRETTGRCSHDSISVCFNFSPRCQATCAEHAVRGSSVALTWAYRSKVLRKLREAERFWGQAVIGGVPSDALQAKSPPRLDYFTRA